jgi:D-glucosaminate-6-phosphate ammonia-lyase
MLRNDSARARHGLGRRALLKSGGGFLAAATLLDGSAVLGQQAGAGSTGGEAPSIYERIGVRPLINCKGTFTIITGSLTLPEVKKAMDEASRHFVNLDELMAAVGQRLAELTGAEGGVVTAGCASAMTAATCACIAGASPEKLQRLPNLDGLKDEVIIPKWSRNVYDHAIRMVGVRIVTAKSMEDLKQAFGPRTAMVYILAGPEDTGPFGLEPIAKLSRERGVPVFVDAAAENLTPEVHLGRGADLVAYSGGKALRGPQCAGLLLGRDDLCQAAWLNSAPHHAFGRSMKVGKEEIMGMLAAVEAWYQRDHEAEWKTWDGYLSQIARKVEQVSGVSTEIILPDSLSNSTPSLKVNWDGSRLGVSGSEIYQALLDGTPRIQTHSFTGTRREGLRESSVKLAAWMMQPGDAEIVAARFHELLSTPIAADTAGERPDVGADVSGRWDAELAYVRGNETHTLFMEQSGTSLRGTHYGEVLSGRLKGWIQGQDIEFRSTHPYEGTVLEFAFQGKVQGSAMAGTVDLGQYGRASWTAGRGTRS